MKDIDSAKRMADATYEALILNEKFDSHHVKKLFKRVHIQMKQKADIISAASGQTGIEKASL